MAIVFFMIKTRSGTQWLHHNLFAPHYFKEVYSDQDPPCPGPESELFRKDVKAVVHDFGQTQENLIVAQLEAGKKYIQSSNIGYWMIPHFLHRWKGTDLYNKLRLVHVIRHPVNNSLSLLKLHGAYFKDEKDNKGNYIDVDSNFYNKNFKKKWSDYTRYERAIIHWYEFHKWMEEIKEEHPDIPCHTVNFEEMMTKEGATKLLEFLELPVKEQAVNSVNHNKDRNRHKRELGDFPSVKKILEFLPIVEMAEGYGYDLNELNDQALAEKYTK